MRMCSAAVRGLTGRARSRRPERAPASRAPGTGAGGRQLPRRAGRLAPCRPRTWTSSCSKSTSASVRSTASCAQAGRVDELEQARLRSPSASSASTSASSASVSAGLGAWGSRRRRLPETARSGTRLGPSVARTRDLTAASLRVIVVWASLRGRLPGRSAPSSATYTANPRASKRVSIRPFRRSPANSSRSCL